jgi:hypothetical protein
VSNSGRAVAEHRFQPGQVAEALEFLKRTRSELRMLRKVRVSREWLRVFDINGDWFEITGVGYVDADVIPILNAVNTPFNRDTIHEPVSAEFKEFQTGRRYAWAADRVM